MNNRKKLWGTAGLIFWAASLVAQTGGSPQQQHQSLVVNIEVPVRVFKKNAFVDGLALRDFEVYEDGVLQQVEAVYLIRNKKVLKEEKSSSAAPSPSSGGRNFILCLDLKEYMPKIGTALDYFFAEVIAPGDSLSVVTPVKTYRFKPEALSRLKPGQIADALKSKLKKDVQEGNALYRTLMRDFYRLEDEEYPPDMIELKEMRLFEQALQIRDVTEISGKAVMAFADALESRAGEKHVFLIFQRDVLPNHPFSSERRMELLKPVNFNVEEIKRRYSDASITIHFLYITKTPAFALKPESTGLTTSAFGLPDLSSNIYAAFKDMAKATGGLTESTGNPDFGLRHAAEASNNYYLVCYRPANYQADGKFKKIEVRIKGDGLEVAHRMGYVAD